MDVVNIGIALSAVTGLLTGAMLVFYMIAENRHQVRIFGLMTVIVATLSVLTLLFSINGSSTPAANALVGGVGLLLSAFLGYAVTTYFLLARTDREASIIPDLRQATLKLPTSGPPRTAIIYYATCEPDQYRSLPYNFTLDHLQAHGMKTPPVLLRPFAMRRARTRYEQLGQSQQRRIHTRIAQKLQDKLGKRYRVYIAFSDNHPFLDEMAAGAVADGARRLIVARAELEQSRNGTATPALLRTLHLDRFGVEVRDTSNLHNSDALVRLYLRRLNTAVGTDRDDVGVLLIGSGHAPEPPGQAAFRDRLSGAFERNGIAAAHIISVTTPNLATLTAAFRQLATAGASRILAMPLSYNADSITIQGELIPLLQQAHTTAASATTLTTFGGWNDDDALIDALAERVRVVA